ncbi:A/G-specific adenine glycosylase [Corynebacterium sp. 153RC1]|uniref:A/G-specific adenine glycosylase n=1 Tax=unclassified Corynebacterium TaxID=2624378 RepID=UPI00211BB2E9|nr:MULTISPECIES: A/G-specific adenine glycosylase [unclassified Corynebacterium]MCQ9353077.1 A/G-specific adenine glycosylase [Corynebacterium sp. 209RC1]MCQ9355281.1 A/G-specific adenine glycosylase [Corynebacterium sp. 1222RC1]MCQ9357545.1 A/G-specific adenine glycosylase [Corynebacterium sp. 122RC1]MCQ9359122.1 A/G-specific adenine glycosylase [Corynebacterium sp. 142RC1]MCQ9361790.1 A/G-specific adenine glycosylase [Corynebacterium sp. 153RC1]
MNELLPVISWYHTHKRTIVWRNEHTTAWGVLVSEVMSQQTQVSRVEPLWEAWMRRWPTPADVASAPTSEVIRAWANLGYPRRALRLQEAARIVAEEGMPTTVEGLLKLPGVGDYTARAVAAFAYGQRVGVVDTNVRRVVSRAFGIKPTIEAVENLLPLTDAPTASVALMELGALVCTKNPQCGACPLSGRCQWDGTVEVTRKQGRFAGSHRQVRGKILALLREKGPVPSVDVAWPDPSMRQVALDSLIADGLVVHHEGHYDLPA